MGAIRRGGAGGLGRDAYDYLFAVGQLASEVEGAEVYAAEGAAGEGEGIGYAGAGGGSDEAGAVNLACYVDDEGRRRSGRWFGGLRDG